MTIGILIMAAGTSSRFKSASNGQHKLLAHLPESPHTILAMSYEKACSAFTPDEILIVTNNTDKDVRTLAQSLTATNISIHTDGLGSSISQAIKACLSGQFPALSNLQGLLVLPADLPFIAPKTLSLLRESLQAPFVRSIRPYYQSHAGHPVGFHHTLFSALSQLSGDEGAKSILRRYPPLPIPVDDPGIIWDIDTPENLVTIPKDNQYQIE